SPAQATSTAIAAATTAILWWLADRLGWLVSADRLAMLLDEDHVMILRRSARQGHHCAVAVESGHCPYASEASPVWETQLGKNPNRREQSGLLRQGQCQDRDRGVQRWSRSPLAPRTADPRR